MNTKQITAWTLAMFMGFAFAAPSAMAEETTGYDNADESSSNVSDPSGEPGNQGGAEASDGSQGNAGGGDTHVGTPTPPENIGAPIKRDFGPRP